MVHCGRTIAAEEGVKALWKGLTPFVGQLTLKYALRMGSNAFFLDLLRSEVRRRGGEGAGRGACLLSVCVGGGDQTDRQHSSGATPLPPSHTPVETLGASLRVAAVAVEGAVAHVATRAGVLGGRLAAPAGGGGGGGGGGSGVRERRQARS